MVESLVISPNLQFWVFVKFASNDAAWVKVAQVFEEAVATVVEQHMRTRDDILDVKVYKLE